jgi:hypothetical protein
MPTRQVAGRAAGLAGGVLTQLASEAITAEGRSRAAELTLVEAAMHGTLAPAPGWPQ